MIILDHNRTQGYPLITIVLKINQSKVKNKFWYKLMKTIQEVDMRVLNLIIRDMDMEHSIIVKEESM